MTETGGVPISCSKHSRRGPGSRSNVSKETLCNFGAKVCMILEKMFRIDIVFGERADRRRRCCFHVVVRLLRVEKVELAIALALDELRKDVIGVRLICFENENTSSRNDVQSLIPESRGGNGLSFLVLVNRGMTGKCLKQGEIHSVEKRYACKELCGLFQVASV